MVEETGEGCKRPLAPEDRKALGEEGAVENEERCGKQHDRKRAAPKLRDAA